MLVGTYVLLGYVVYNYFVACTLQCGCCMYEKFVCESPILALRWF